ncbi:MAG TPA: FecR domain-containing protein [Opitutales bacterium]|nr:FecR domain-containing protein [Opitutales bacterium]
MKHPFVYLAALLGLFALPQVSHAQDMTNGKVQAMIVVGNVNLIAKDGTTTALKRGQSFEEGASVHADKGANALLVLSNGATLKVKENTTLEVTKFQQAKFDEAAEGTYLRLTKDPSKSETTLKLSDGSLQGEVKKLDTADGSKFTVNTPAGSAGIRGTIVDITIVRNAAGQITSIVANCVVGSVNFTPSVSSTISTQGGTTTTVNNQNALGIGTNGQIAINLTVDPLTGQITGGAITGASVNVATSQGMANDLAAIVNEANTLQGNAQQPPVSVPATTAPVTLMDSGGNVITTATLGTATNTTPTPNGGTTTTTNPTITNPQNASVPTGP